MGWGQSGEWEDGGDGCATLRILRDMKCAPGNGYFGKFYIMGILPPFLKLKLKNVFEY